MPTSSNLSCSLVGIGHAPSVGFRLSRDGRSDSIYQHAIHIYCTLHLIQFKANAVEILQYILQIGQSLFDSNVHRTGTIHFVILYD